MNKQIPFNKKLLTGVLLAGQLGCIHSVAAEENSASNTARLEQLITKQQQQLEVLKQQVDQLKSNSSAPVDVTMQTPTAVSKIVHGDPKAKTKLVVSGWVNQMLSVVDDGEGVDAYIVDNDFAESRIKFLGTVAASEDLTIGAKIELTIAPNKSGNVSQTNQDINNIFDQRYTEVFLQSERWGKLSLGKGFTPSHSSALRDLSGTAIVASANITDQAGGLFFRERDNNALTDIRILDGFNSFDGLNRRNRLRYDTPTFNGFSLATSLVSDSRYDATLSYQGQGYGLKVLGAAAIAEPNLANAGLQYDGSVSMLHEATGLNLTLAAGMLEQDDQDNPSNLFAKFGLIKNYTRVGQTAFSLDYTRSKNLPNEASKSTAYGLSAVQQLNDWGTEVYASYRIYSLDLAVGNDVNDIQVLSVGARVKF
ncbi:porin [Pseudoalteromonas sp.]|uniref:porin n=1 Tax=Pseudoalteromonas sp. TaxID=53249 RepID=UPI003568F72F